VSDSTSGRLVALFRGRSHRIEGSIVDAGTLAP
jgi:hypothetical protein